MSLAVAYAWKDGEIGIADEGDVLEVPMGIRIFARGERSVLEARLAAVAEPDEVRDQLVVPGLREIDGSERFAAIDHLISWTARAFRDWPLREYIHQQPGIDSPLPPIRQREASS